MNELYQIGYWNNTGESCVFPVLDQKEAAVNTAHNTARKHGESTLSIYSKDGNLLQLVAYQVVDGKLHCDTLRA